MIPHGDASAFLAQNDWCAETLTHDDVEPYAQHHAGNMFVLFGYTPEGLCVKMHDTWGDPADGRIVVHTYDADSDATDPTQAEAYFNTGREAFDHFKLLLIHESVVAASAPLSAAELLAMPKDARIVVNMTHDETGAPTVVCVKVDVERDMWYPTGFESRVEMFPSEELAHYGARPA